MLRQGGYKRGEALILIGLGDLYVEVEDFEIAEQNYRYAQGLAQQLGARFLINYLALAQFNLALLKKDRAEASIASEQCVEPDTGRRLQTMNMVFISSLRAQIISLGCEAARGR